MLSLRNRKAERVRRRQNICVKQKGQAYYLTVLSCLLLTLVFFGSFAKRSV